MKNIANCTFGLLLSVVATVALVLSKSEAEEAKSKVLCTRPSGAFRIETIAGPVTDEGPIGDVFLVSTGDETQRSRLPKESVDSTAAHYLKLGTAKFDNGDFGGAVTDYTKAIKINPKSADAYNNRGIAKASQRDYKGAVADYTKAIEINPRFADAYYSRGNAKNDMADYHGAMADFTKAIEIDPKFSDAYLNRGNCYLHKQDYDRAIADYNKAIEINPNEPGPYSNRGVAKASKKDYDGAIVDYTRAIEIDPRGADLYHNRGLAKASKGDYDGAIADHTRAVEIDPKYAKAYLDRANSYLFKGEYGEAIADYNNAIEFDPKNAALYRNRGIAEQLRGDLAGALIDLTRDDELALPESDQDYSQLWVWLLRMQQAQADKANKRLSAYLDKRSATGDWVSKIGAFLLGKMTQTKFLAAGNSSEEDQPCDAWYFAGMKHLLAGDKQAAVDCFNKCLSTDKEAVDYMLAQVQLKTLGGSSLSQ